MTSTLEYGINVGVLSLFIFEKNLRFFFSNTNKRTLTFILDSRVVINLVENMHYNGN